jgi:thiamine-phosphate pyrophosphorylase
VVTPAPDTPLIVLTDRRQCARPLPDVLAAAAAAGARLFVLREKDLPDRDRQALARRLRGLLAPARLLLAGPVPGPDGCHLAAADPVPPRPSGLVGRSCHRPGEIVAAAAGGAHYATLSPVFRSLSKPSDGRSLVLSALAHDYPIPVYALGGVQTPDRAEACIRAGADGVAVMGAAMRHPELVGELLAAVRP